MYCCIVLWLNTNASIEIKWNPLVLRPQYSWKTRSISWLFMPWRMMPHDVMFSHYIGCKHRFLSSIRKIINDNDLWHVGVEKRYKCKHILSFLNNSAHKGLKLTKCLLLFILNGPLTRYLKLWVAHGPGMPGMFSPPPTSKETVS